MADLATVPGVYTSLAELVALQHKARGFSFLPRQPLHSILSGRHASRLRGRGLNFEEMRRYFPGDDVRRIDWKATLRTRRAQLRVYTEERERSVFLLVDQRRAMFFGSQRSMKSVTAAEMAAVTAWRVLRQQDRIGALIFNDTDVVEIRPQRSRKTVMQILHAVVQQNRALSLKTPAQAHPEMFNRVLRQVEQLARHDSLVCLITDGQGHDDESNAILTRLSRHNDVLVAFIYDPLEKEIPRSGQLVVSDGTRQMEIDTDNDSFRAKFRQTFQERLARAKGFLLHREVPVVPLSTAEELSSQLGRYLGGDPK